MEFKLSSEFKPAGDQPQAVVSLVQGLKKGLHYQTLLGVTGSGKTFTMASVVAELQRPALVIVHNKTLAAQLCNEFREFFPHNAVEYFVSYYDYYQPEAYLPNSDTYIEKEAQINSEIDRLRHSATQALLTRRDVLVVASVSSIYGLGSPTHYRAQALAVKKGEHLNRSDFLRRLVDLQFIRTNDVLERGRFRARGLVIDIFPSNQDLIYRLVLSGPLVSRIDVLDPVTRRVLESVDDLLIFPTSHFVTPEPVRRQALKAIRAELAARLAYFNQRGLLLEAERLERRTRYDLELISEIGYCNGIENYSRHLDGRPAGAPPATLLDYFPSDFLLFIDESHVTIPQLHGMWNGDRARKRALIDNGFRLESAYDNRPLTFAEFEQRLNQAVFVSATPGPFEIKHSAAVVEQIIRPTGLVDPAISIRPITPSQGQNQIEDLIAEVKIRAAKNERSLVTTLTKKMAEDLTAYLLEQGVKAKYLHSDVKTIERIRLLTEFRQGKFDCLIGVNLLREGLDLPEVTLVAILDADKEGFLRSATSLIQTIGRAARNVLGQVILYADHPTGSISRAVAETNRRREKQIAYNQAHGITPQTIKKNIRDLTALWGIKDESVQDILNLELSAIPADHLPDLIAQKEAEMRRAAKNLEFELAAILRDEINLLKKESKTKKVAVKNKNPRS